MLFCEYFYSIWWTGILSKTLFLTLLHGLLWKIPGTSQNTVRYYFFMPVSIQFLFIYPGEDSRNMTWSPDTFKRILMRLIYIYRSPMWLMMRGLFRPFRAPWSRTPLCLTPRGLQIALTWLVSQSPSLKWPRDRLALQSKCLEKAWWGEKRQTGRCLQPGL